jgi:hypothetical protein
VSLNVSHEEHLLTTLSDTGSRSSIIIEAYTSSQFINNNHENKNTWSTMGGQFITDKTGLMTFSLPEFNLKKQFSWVFHVNDRLESSSTYDMIIGQDLLGELGIILNFNYKTVTWDTETILMKDRGTMNAQESLIEVYLTENEPQTLISKLSFSTKILDAEYKPI